MPAKSRSLCTRKRTKDPNKCIKVRGCKVASGTKRTFCRKKHNRKGTRKGTRRSL